MTDILDLPGWNVLGRSEEDGADVLEAEYPQATPTVCPICGTERSVYKHGTKANTYTDIPMRGRPAKLRAKVQRYRCTFCKETFLQPLGGLVDGRRMTERCATYIKAHILRDTFTRIAETVGCDDKTVRTLGAEYMAELQASFRPSMGAAEPWRLATLYPANPTKVQLLRKMQDNRCQSCGTEFGRAADDRARVVALVRGKTRRQQLVCAACSTTFHAEALNHKKPLSTRKSG